MCRLIFWLTLIFVPIAVFAQIPTAKEIVYAVKLSTDNDFSPVAEMLNGCGYKVALYPQDGGYSTTLYTLNCSVSQLDPNRLGSNGIEFVAQPSNSESSLAQVATLLGGQQFQYLNVTVYSREIVDRWLVQLKNLGYEGGFYEGNHGCDWDMTKDQYPNVTIWNDYGDTYILTCTFKF